MMKRNQFVAFILTVFLASCSPRVVTQITKRYPPIVKPDSVKVFEIGQKVPNDAQVLGRVDVKNGGFTTQGHYNDVVRLAKNEVAKAGGNGLMLTGHSLPGASGSSGHQISGMMLLLNKDKANSDSLRKDLFKGLSSRQEDVEEEKVGASNLFSVGLGYGYMTTNIYDNNYLHGVMPQHNGVDWRIQYEHLFNGRIGLGIIYSGYRSSGQMYGMSDTFTENYIAPMFSARWLFNDVWILKGEFGMGYYRHDERAGNGYHLWGEGVGLNLDAGIEYKVSKHVGLGISAGILSGIMDKLKDNRNNTYDPDFCDDFNITRFNVLAGLRYYF